MNAVQLATTLVPWMVLAPLIGAFLVMLLPREGKGFIKGFSLVFSLAVFAVSIFVARGFDFAGHMQLESTIAWIPQFGVNFHFGADAISMWLILLTTFLMPITILGSFTAFQGREKEFYFWLLVLLSAMLGVFVARDVLFFYTCFELTLVPLYFLIGIYGGAQRRWAAQKFFIFTLAGSALTLVGILYVAFVHASQPGGTWNFQIDALVATGKGLSLKEQSWVLAALLAGFAVKVPLFPVHTWLPLAHTEAPTSGSVILAGVLLKLGTYGLLRFAIPMAPAAVVGHAPLIAVASIIGILYAALICWVQEDIKKLVAYSSISHLGFCVLGMFALNTVGMAGSVAYMVNHGLSTGALFLCVGMIYERFHTRDMNQLTGLGKTMPVWSCFMVFFCMASVGLPGLNGFVGEFLTLLGAFTARGEVLSAGYWYAAVAGVGMILAAIYILYMVGRVVMGQPRAADAGHGHGHDHAHGSHAVKDLNFREIATLFPLAVACLVLGIYPKPMLDSLEAPIKQTLTNVQAVIDNKPRGLEQASVVQPTTAAAARQGLVHE